MINIRRLAFAAAIAAAGIASPALAQSFDPEVGTGNIAPLSFGPAAGPALVVPNAAVIHRARHHAVAATRSGLNAFAMVPATQGGSAFDPALTGGGSAGYNETLHNSQW